MRYRTMRSDAGSTSRPVSDGVAVVTIGSLLTDSTAALAPSSGTPRLDAEVLLAHVLGVDRTRLVLDHRSQLDSEIQRHFDRLMGRRAAGEPVAYLIGRRPFRALELFVDRRVLIPRPETEGLVEAAVAELPLGASVLDVGTGSGAIALALATERPDLRVRGVDVSPDAVAVAQRNASNLNLDLSFTVADLLEGEDGVDAVIANLPYVEADATLPVDVAAFEPSLALYAGEQGLDLFRRLAAQLAAREWPSRVLLEIGESQGAAVCALLHEAGFGAVEVRQDLSGRDRVVLGRRGGLSPSGDERAGRTGRRAER
jgi:release factor glutamine methyltransferase